MVHIQSGGTYQIVNVKSETTLDLSGGDNKSIIGYGWHNGDNQKWIFENNGSWTIKSAGSGQYLAVEGDPNRDGVPIIAASDPFQWDIWPDEKEPDHYRIFAPGTEKNFDLSDHGNVAPGTIIQLWQKTPGKNQTWEFKDI